jgi:hypothetical protein
MLPSLLPPILRKPPGFSISALRSSDGAVALIRRLSWDQHLANLVALADDFKLRLPIVSANDLPPDLTGELGDEQAPK